MHTKFQHINKTFSIFPDLNRTTPNVNFKGFRVEELTQLGLEDYLLPMADDNFFVAALVTSPKSNLFQMLH